MALRVEASLECLQVEVVWNLETTLGSVHVSLPSAVIYKAHLAISQGDRKSGQGQSSYLVCLQPPPLLTITFFNHILPGEGRMKKSEGGKWKIKACRTKDGGKFLTDTEEGHPSENDLLSNPEKKLQTSPWQIQPQVELQCHQGFEAKAPS